MFEGPPSLLLSLPRLGWSTPTHGTRSSMSQTLQGGKTRLSFWFWLRNSTPVLFQSAINRPFGGYAAAQLKPVYPVVQARKNDADLPGFLMRDYLPSFQIHIYEVRGNTKMKWFTHVV
ncbi:hypothetical protein BDZ97DRAFT_1924683 [Flammula alnicola]|nr:hypothetical protein BDZ97DRAFT_1924683 [Flammula alnicola]